MNQQNFIERFAEAVMADPKAIQPATELKSLENWDSMALVSVVALLDEFGAKPAPGALEKCRTVSDIMALVP